MNFFLKNGTLGVIMLRKSVYLLVLALGLIGAGCQSSPTTTQSYAEPLRTDLGEQPVSDSNGFGALPSLAGKSGKPTITFASTLPILPGKVTVLRFKRSTPNVTEMKNLATAIGLPGFLTGDQPDVRELTVDWNDEFGFHWNYLGSERRIEFEKRDTPRQPLTINQLPSNNELIQISDDFLMNRGVNPKRYHDGQLIPDWNLWWINAKTNGKCPDESSLVAIRTAGASAGLTASTPPTLPDMKNTICVDPEFPNRVTIKYWSYFDGIDAFDQHGDSIIGATIIVDATKKSVIGGSFTLPGDPERSDYTARSQEEINNILKTGGIAGVNGNITLNQYSIGYLYQDAQENGAHMVYLIPSVIADGTKTENGTNIDHVRLVVPLVKP